MDKLLKSDAYLELVTITVVPFVLEYQGNFQDAIHGHDKAANFLGEFLIRYKKIVGKVHRKMFERQAIVHTERKKYLEGFKGNFKGVIVPPTIRSADDEMVLGEGQARILSLVSCRSLEPVNIELSVNRIIENSPAIVRRMARLIMIRSQLLSSIYFARRYLFSHQH